MRKHRISDQDAEAVMSGHAPVARPELAPLATSIESFRSAAFETIAQPSAELASRLELASDISTRTSLHPGAVVAAGPARGGIRSEKRRVRMFSWIAGLGLATKIALGAGVAVAATVGAGAVGVLPTGAQDAFNGVVSTIIPGTGEAPEGVLPTGTDEPTPEPSSAAHPENFGGWVSDRAHDPAKDGHTFGAETSEAAKQNGQSDVDKGSEGKPTQQPTEGSTHSPEQTRQGSNPDDAPGKPGN